MIRIRQIKLNNSGFENDPEKLKDILREKAAKLLRVDPCNIGTLSVRSHAIDARKKPDLFHVYTVDLTLKGTAEDTVLKRVRNKDITPVHEKPYAFPYTAPSVYTASSPKTPRPLIAGFGPAGMLAAYMLAKAGYRPVVIERGRDIDSRKKDVETFFRTGVLDTASNVQFGEGGAGTFSDGKLNSGIKDKSGRIRKILEVFVSMGAPDEILTESSPHIGTDRLAEVVRSLRADIIRSGGEVRFNTKLTDIIAGDGSRSLTAVTDDGQIDASALIIATGHSARDTFRMLSARGLAMEPKPFAVGLRVQHPQALINLAQYGIEHPENLPAAPYKLTAKASSGRGVYSFCMCPGGYIINASSENGMTAVNGMSHHARDGAAANSAIVVTLSPADYGNGSLFSGIEFQERIESAAFNAAQGLVPVQYLDDYRLGRASEENILRQKPQVMGAYRFTDLCDILPGEIRSDIIEGMSIFGKKIRGFDNDDTILAGVESRTSSPLRILRGDDLRSVTHPLIFPCGEGAGYAGGIISAAVDGIRVAEAVAEALT